MTKEERRKKNTRKKRGGNIPYKSLHSGAPLDLIYKDPEYMQAFTRVKALRNKVGKARLMEYMRKGIIIKKSWKNLLDDFSQLKGQFFFFFLLWRYEKSASIDRATIVTEKKICRNLKGRSKN